MLTKFSICFIILICGYTVMAQVGINTVDPRAMLDVNGNLSLNAASISVNEGGNAIVSGDYSFLNITGPINAFTINTIKPLTDADGQLLTLVNTTIHPMTIAHDTGATINSVFLPNKNNLLLNGIYSTATLQYNKSRQRWFVLKYADNDIYQRRIYSSVGKTDVEMNSSNYEDMPNMSVSFIPKNSLIYVNVSIAGNMATKGINNELTQGYADFILVKTVGPTSTLEAGATSIATDIDEMVVATSFNVRFAMYPVEVTPGVATEIKVQWRRNGQNPSTIYCSAESIDQDSSHRSITIFD